MLAGSRIACAQDAQPAGSAFGGFDHQQPQGGSRHGRPRPDPRTAPGRGVVSTAPAPAPQCKPALVNVPIQLQDTTRRRSPAVRPRPWPRWRSAGLAAARGRRRFTRGQPIPMPAVRRRTTRRCPTASAAPMRPLHLIGSGIDADRLPRRRQGRERPAQQRRSDAAENRRVEIRPPAAGPMGSATAGRQWRAAGVQLRHGAVSLVVLPANRVLGNQPALPNISGPQADGPASYRSRCCMSLANPQVAAATSAASGVLRAATASPR